MKTQYFLGVDVGKNSLHVALTMDGQNFYDQEVANDGPSIKEYFRDLKAKFSISFENLVVCMEHTGIYCYPILEYLTGQKIRVYVEHAARIKQSGGLQRGKNDVVDSKRIAKYAYKNVDELKFWQPKREVIQKLGALLEVRERLVRTRTQLEVPLKENKGFRNPSIEQIATKACKSALTGIRKSIKKVESEIEQLVKSDVKLLQQVKLATSVPGVGVITAANMILTSNEFQDISDHKKFACYAGVAPFEHSSGKSIRGKTRVSHMANKKVKRLLHLCARSAVMHSEEFRIYYERKKLEEKSHFSVLNAVCNKLISRVFVCINQQRMYQKNYQNVLA